MWAIPTGASWLLKKIKKYQVKSPNPESRVPETGSNPPIGSDRDSGRDRASTLILVGEMREAHTTYQTTKAPLIKTKVFQIQLLHLKIKVLKDFL